MNNIENVPEVLFNINLPFPENSELINSTTHIPGKIKSQSELQAPEIIINKNNSFSKFSPNNNVHSEESIIRKALFHNNSKENTINGVSRRPSSLDKHLRSKRETNIFYNFEDLKKKKISEKILESLNFQFFLIICTLFSLFGADIQIITCDNTSDEIWDVFFWLNFVVFLIEIVLSVNVNKNYPLSFFFWLDMFSTLSILIDISMINKGFFGGSNPSKITRASRAAKIGTKAGRIGRFTRLIKIWKVVFLHIKKISKTIGKNINLITKSMTKITKNQGVQQLDDSISSNKSFVKDFKICPKEIGKTSLTSKFSKFNSGQSINSALKAYNLNIYPEEIDTESLKESRVGKKLSELTTKRVVGLVLLLMLSIPLFSSNYYFESEKAYIIILKQIANLSLNSDFYSTNKTTDLLINATHDTEYPLVFLNISSISYFFQSSTYGTLRLDEQEEYLIETQTDLFRAVINTKSVSEKNALISIIRNIFVTLVLALSAFYFHKDVNTLALRPIERMIERINAIAANPLAKDNVLISSDKNASFETTNIENSISKIGTLLGLGFGDAGAEIIAQNMSQDGDIDPMSAGKKQFAVFGFCDIRNFTDTTEVLQEEVMVFVNSVAHIVHKSVDKYAGSANKNIGDAFLLVWKIPNQYGDNRNRITKNICDFSVISFLKIIASINQKQSLLKYRTNRNILARIPNYKVKMGFGLHFGWAIEGAIGSNFKIDASYLSPNVNLASRLEAATKQYGVFLLISGVLFHKLSKRTQRFCREIDRVTLKGSKLPMRLFTIDIDVSELPISQEEKGYTKKELEIKHRLSKNQIYDAFLNTEGDISKLYKTSEFFFNDKKLLMLTKTSFGAFRNNFLTGFEYYIKGEWEKAKIYIERSYKEKGEDGPSTTLLNFMKENKFNAGSEWLGYRELTEK